jgi:hypothetical protein
LGTIPGVAERIGTPASYDGNDLSGSCSGDLSLKQRRAQKFHHLDNKQIPAEPTPGSDSSM